MREVIGSVYDYRCGKDLNMFGQVIGFLYRPDTDKEEKTAQTLSFPPYLYRPDTDKEEKTEFELSGLIAEELEVMGRKERRAVMRRAGLNPDLYDF